MRFTADFLRELPSFAIADIAGGGSDHLCDTVSFAEFAHVETDESTIASEKMLGDGFREECLPDAAWAEEEEGRDRTIRVPDAGDGTDERMRDRVGRILLTDDGFREYRRDICERSVLLFEEELLFGEASRSRERAQDILGGNDDRCFFLW